MFIKHNLCEGQLNHSFRRICQIFIVDRESSEVLQPSERAFDNPSFGRYMEFGRRLVRSENDLHNPAEFFCDPVSERTLIPTIGKNFRQARELASHLLDNYWGALAVMEVRLMDSNTYREPKCVNNNMFFMTLDLFIPVNPLQVGAA